ncbi:alanine racemase [Anaerolineales bacterium HSG24]|nr:alanine racemase [Anaerolineales bacterium HSG24]
MYLENVLHNNENLLKVTMDLHQQGKLPVNSWVIDLDQIAVNAKMIAQSANDNKLKTFVMSKQHNRNPYINAVAQKMGLGNVVAVDFQCALSSRDYQIPLGHVGHLNQIPKHLIPQIVSLSPEVMTVYSIDQAQWINEAAQSQKCLQDIIIRVYDDNDCAFLGQEGGIHVDAIPVFIDKLKKLSSVNLIGLTAFPCLSYNSSGDEAVTATSNVDAINKAREIFTEKGIEARHINMPGNTSSSEMKLLKELGATHVEPGNSILGTSPNHAFFKNRAESTAISYLSEVSHFYDDRVYAFGGGCYHTNYSDKMYAYIGSNWEVAKNQGRIFYNHDIVQDIDYHMQFEPTSKQQVSIGDSVVSSFRTQMHMTRSYHVAVSGISGDRPLKVHAILNNGREPLDQSLSPIGHQAVIDDISEILTTY